MNNQKIENTLEKHIYEQIKKRQKMFVEPPLGSFAFDGDKSPFNQNNGNMFGPGNPVFDNRFLNITSPNNDAPIFLPISPIRPRGDLYGPPEFTNFNGNPNFDQNHQ